MLKENRSLLWRGGGGRGTRKLGGGEKGCAVAGGRSSSRPSVRRPSDLSRANRSGSLTKTFVEPRLRLRGRFGQQHLQAQKSMGLSAPTLCATRARRPPRQARETGEVKVAQQTSRMAGRRCAYQDSGRLVSRSATERNNGGGKEETRLFCMRAMSTVIAVFLPRFPRMGLQIVLLSIVGHRTWLLQNKCRVLAERPARTAFASSRHHV